MYLLCIYKNPIISSLLKINTLNFTMYILTTATCPLKRVIRLHNLISDFSEHFIHRKRSSVFMIVKRKPKTNKNTF